MSVRAAGNLMTCPDLPTARPLANTSADAGSAITVTSPTIGVSESCTSRRSPTPTVSWRGRRFVALARCDQRQRDVGPHVERDGRATTECAADADAGTRRIRAHDQRAVGQAEPHRTQRLRLVSDHLHVGHPGLNPAWRSSMRCVPASSSSFAGVAPCGLPSTITVAPAGSVSTVTGAHAATSFATSVCRCSIPSMSTVALNGKVPWRCDEQFVTAGRQPEFAWRRTDVLACDADSSGHRRLYPQDAWQLRQPELEGLVLGVRHADRCAQSS